MFKARLLTVVATLGIVALLAGACVQPAPTPTPVPTPAPSPTPTPEPTLSGILNVYVTDAPPREQVTSIMVTVTEVQVHKALAEQEQQQVDGGTQTQEQEQQQTQQGEGEWITIDLSDNATTFDLLQVMGTEQFLGTSEVESGKYTQVRLVIDTVQVRLGNGDLQDATVPSKELKIVHPFDVVAGETTAMVIDFDADKMVTVTGAGSIIVKPVVKLTVRPEKPQQADTEQALIEVSCEDFISNQHISKEAEVAVGELFKVSLCSNQTTGFNWSELAQIGDQTIIEQLGHKFIPPQNKQLIGAAGQEIWTFKALKEGTTTISMEYSQPWEGGMKAEWTFELTVTVK